MRRRASACYPHCASAPRSTAAAGTTTASAGASRPRAGDCHRARCWSRPPAPSPTRRSRPSPAWTPSRARSSTRPAGTATTTSPASGGGRSAPARRPSRSCPRSSRRWRGCAVYQRTPAVDRARGDRAGEPAARSAVYRRMPAAQRAVRGAASTAAARCWSLGIQAAGGCSGRSGGRAQAPGRPGARPGAARRAAPRDYTIGCKRILISNDYYPALARPTSRSSPTAIAEVRRDRHRHRRRRRAADVDTIMLRHRLRGDRPADRAADRRPRRPDAGPGVGARR